MTAINVLLFNVLESLMQEFQSTKELHTKKQVRV